MFFFYLDLCKNKEIIKSVKKISINTFLLFITIKSFYKIRLFIVDNFNINTESFNKNEIIIFYLIS